MFLKDSAFRRFRARWWFAALLALMLSLPVLAQMDVASQLLGTITDPTGAVVPHATISVRNQQTGVVVKAVSDDRGNYFFASLQAGTYAVSCAQTGFKTFVAPGVVLQAQKTVTLSVLLQLGTSEQSVEVSSASEMVNTVSATVQTTYDTKILQNLPVWGRDPRESMELLMPGAVAEDDFLLSAHPTSLPRFQVEPLAEFLGGFNRSDVSGRIGIADGSTFVVKFGLREHASQFGLPGVSRLARGFTLSAHRLFFTTGTPVPSNST